jgi:outer membrane receptor protein involved in Fe transport
VTANVYTVGGEAFGIRGIAHNSASTRGGQGESGSYYLDGVALTGFAKRFGPDDLWDVQSVEILRGPQSTNVGRNAIAGAVVIQTRDPDFSRSGSVRVRAADADSYSLDAMGNLPLGEAAAVRGTLHYATADGFVTNPTRGEDDYDARETLSLRGKYRWQGLDGRLTGVLALQYAETERGEDFVLLEYRDDLGNRVTLDPADRINLANLEAFETNDSWLASLTLDYRISETWRITSQTAFLTADYSRFDDDDQLPRGGNAFRGREATDRNWSEEIRLLYAGDNGLRGVIGLFGTVVDLDNQTDALINISPNLVGVPATLLPFYPDILEVGAPSTVENETRNLAVFTEWEKDLGERWTVFAGARFDHEELDSFSTGARTLLTDLPDPATPGLPPPLAAGLAQVNAAILGLITRSEQTVATSYDAFLPQAGLRYRVSDRLTLGLLAERGYRAGGVDINAAGIRTEYDPEYLNNLEASLRSRWLDDRLRVNLNVYYGAWEDQQVGVQVQENNTVDVRTLNAGESELYGFELEATGVASDTLTWFANLGYAHTEFLTFSSTEGDFSGNRFGFAPEWTGAAGATWQFQPDWSLHGNVTYTGGAFTDPANTFAIDAHTVTNLRLAFTPGSQRLALYVNNLFDEVYLLNRTTNFDPSTLLGKVGAPRVVGIEWSARF